ncbi:MAG: SpoVA/SpoVAEb family sporulation membrane protein [Clostridia bacterium]|nr:SpoVA/SpoVAEb family sporulation membrane protein [Clostridia bacterium]
MRREKRNVQDLILDCVKAFLVGGAFCVIAQLLIDLTAITPARILVLYVCSGVFLSAVGLFEPLRRFAGCGASVPLVGFGGLIARGVREAIQKDGVMGILSGPLTASAAGIAAALTFGFLAAVFFKGKPKKL